MTAPSIETTHMPPQVRPLMLAIDPLDGSSNIDTNVSISTIFAVCPAKDQPDASFLRPARELTAGGCIIHGPRCCLMVSFGDGTQIYTLNPDTYSFDLTAPRMTMPGCFSEFAINASHYRHWPPVPHLYRRLPGRDRRPPCAELQLTLDATITDLHGRTPLVFGFAAKVDRFATCHDLPDAEVSALFAIAACCGPEVYP